MPDPNRQTRIDETDAKGGTNEGVVRWVLGISLSLAVVALTLIWVTGALTQGPVESQQNVARKEQAEREQAGSDGSSTDAVLADDQNAAAPPTTADQ